jgi:biotin carboxylase
MNEIKKRMLIAGGAYADIPLIKAAQNLGFHVITSGNRPEDAGHQYSDEYHPADYSDPEAILELSKRLNISAICACCNDFSALSTAYAAEKLGLPGHDPYETALTIHHKDRYRTFALANNIPAPRALSFNSKQDALNGLGAMPFPALIKPVDRTGGRGISVINGMDGVESAIDEALAVSKTNRFVVEEFVEGSRHGFSAFLYNGRVVFYFSDNEHYFLNPYLVAAASVPSIAPPEVAQRLCAESEKIASLLSLKTGIFHIQYILRDKKEPVIIEICRRAPGDLYIKLVEFATGVDYSAWIVKAAAGMDCAGLRHVEPTGCFVRHCIMSAVSGRTRNIRFDPSIEKNIIKRFIWYIKGDLIADVMNSKFGIVFLKFDSREEMLEKTDQLQELIKVEVE